jgi:anti-sigma regulatory factor (Ser/Thr protein kinase)
VQRTDSFIIGSNRAAISAFAETLQDWAARHQVPTSVLQAFQIAFDELLTNTIEHGLADCEHPRLEVHLRLDDDRLQAELIDNGQPFDPLSGSAEPDLDSALDDRAIGGLGIHLVRNLMDELRYQRSAHHNHLFIAKRLPQPPAP